jgi:tRNA(fMet)-specific endonuclease VapC
MKYLLDTNTCIRFINGRNPRIREHFLEVDDADLAVSTITRAELFYGSAKSQTPAASRAKQREFLRRFSTLPFDNRAAEVYGPMRAVLEQRGLSIGQNDMLIAAIALANNLTLVTHNTREFERIDQLRLEDWEI